jgi:diaminopimelate decarboxylase
MKLLSAARIERVAAEHGTPCYVYDAEVFRARIALLRDFDVVRYAQKASSNVHLLRLVRECGALLDAV